MAGGLTDGDGNAIGALKLDLGNHVDVLRYRGVFGWEEQRNRRGVVVGGCG